MSSHRPRIGRWLVALAATTLSAAALCPRPASAACEVLLPGSGDELDETACGPINPPQVIGTPGNVPKLIAWTGGYDVNPLGGMRGGIYLARVDGTARRKIVTFSNRTRDFEEHGLNLPDDHPSFSPDNRKIVFTSNRFDEHDWDVFVMNVNGSSPARLAAADGLDTEPVYSPDGTRIAITTERAPFAPPYGNVHVIRVADGASLANLTADLRLAAGDPFWSRDGSLIAYFHSFTRFLNSPQRLFVMTASGSGKFHIPGHDPVNVHPAIGLAIDDDGDGTPNYLESGSVGEASFAPAAVSAGRWETLSFTWRHPEAWRLIDRMGVRFADGRHLLGAIHHQIEDESFSLFDGASENDTGARLLGTGIVRSPLLALDLDRSRIVNVDTETVSLVLVVRFAPRFIGRTLRVRAEAGDADGNAQDEELTTLAVLAPSVGLDPLRIAPPGSRRLPVASAAGW